MLAEVQTSARYKTVQNFRFIESGLDMARLDSDGFYLIICTTTPATVMVTTKPSYFLKKLLNSLADICQGSQDQRWQPDDHSSTGLTGNIPGQSERGIGAFRKVPSDSRSL
ncbi:hypothetical protein ROHU_007375 [Labeo rohita]|uniref:Uncharacterized protein n=1 Tax=Labeo rohita TaxID=84645 RepID=A0A498MDT4_LABRO|nr:hypothetical protein ROHU_007375 [Labeo rohita]